MEIRARIRTFGLRRHGRNYPPADKYVDCRFLPNPWSFHELRSLSGAHPRVRSAMVAMLAKLPEHRAELNAVADKMENYVFDVLRGTCIPTICFYCHGGMHRSVFAAEYVSERLSLRGVIVELVHLDAA